MKKVVIIGAGPAGLTAAYELLKKSKDYEVIILEEDKSVGGISKTINYKENRMDLGGHRFFTKNQRIKDLWLEILPIQGKDSYDDKKLKKHKELVKNGPDPEKEDNVMLIRNRVSRIFYHNKFFDYPVTFNFKTIKNLGFINTIICGFSYLRYKIFKRKENNLEDFYINRFGKKLYSMFFEGYTEKVWGRSPKNISKEWGYQRVKGISITAVLKDYFLRVFKIKNKNKEASLIEQFYYPKYGPGELYEQMAKKIVKMGGVIKKNSKVISIRKTKNKITSVKYMDNDKEYTLDVDYLISSMPIKDLVSSLNNVSKDVKAVSDNLPYRDFITVGVLVDSLSIKNKTNIKTINDNIPDCWLYIQDPRVKLGRIQIFNNWSPYMVKDVDNKVFLGLEYFCSEGDDFWNLSDKKIKQLAESELRKMNLIDSKIIDSCCYRVKKAYPAYFDSYKDFEVVKKYLLNISNLYCIGRNGQHRYNNMDHSMMTGIMTVDCILNNSSKMDVWSVNTDKNYHEDNINKNKKM